MSVNPESTDLRVTVDRLPAGAKPFSGVFAIGGANGHLLDDTKGRARRRTTDDRRDNATTNGVEVDMQDETSADEPEYSTGGPPAARIAVNTTETSGPEIETDGGTVKTDGGTTTQAARDHRDIDYLDAEVNLLRPSTPFMRDHLRVVWTGFVAWALLVFGPVTLTAIAPGVMTSEMPVIGFPLHYFAVAVGAPTGALLLSIWYARERDGLDAKYGIEPATADRTEGDDEAVAAADGGVTE